MRRKTNVKSADRGRTRQGGTRAGSRTSYRKSQTTRRRILDSAAYLFRRKGYAATSLRDIAARSHMISGSIYYHFGSKEEILDAVLQQGIMDLHSAVEKAVREMPDDATPHERIAVAVRAHLTALLKQGDYIRANATEFERAPRAIRKRNLALRQNYAAFWRSLFENARTAGQIRQEVDLRLLRLFILGALHWTVDWYDPSKEPIPVLADTLVDFFSYGVVREPGPRPVD